MSFLVKRKRLIIYRGSDITTPFSLTNRETGYIFQLTGATQIQAIFTKSDRSDLILTMTEIPAVNAFGTYTDILFTALTAGAIGNDVALVFDGIKDVDTVVSEWNAANPGNTVEHDGIGTEVLVTGTLDLEEGFNAYTPITILDALNGIIQVILIDAHTSLLRIGENQDVKFIVDFGEHPTGQRVKGELVQKLDVFQ